MRLSPSRIGTEVAVSRHFGVLRYARAEEVYLRATRGAESIIPSDAIVIGMQMSGAAYYYTGRTMLRWDSIQPDDFQTLRSYAGSRPWYALLADFELAEATQRTGVEWSPVARFDSVTLYRLKEHHSED